MFEIYAFWSVQFWLLTVWFVLAWIITFFIPGLVLSERWQLPRTHRLVAAPVVGLVTWGLLGYGLGWLGWRWGQVVYLVVMLLWAWRRRSPLTAGWQGVTLSRVSLLLLGGGALLTLLPLVGSGWQSSVGIRYYFVNIFDGVFHLSLTRALVESVPPQQPGAIGLLVTNYHYLSDLILADLARIWHLPVNHLYFHWMPAWMSVWLGLVLVLLVRSWFRRPVAEPLALFLFYWSGELSWLFNWLLPAESLRPFEVYIDHGIQNFLNPPQAYAKLVLLTVLLIWPVYLRRRSWFFSVGLGIMVASLVSLKVYYGIGAVLFLGFYYLVTGADQWWQGQLRAQWGFWLRQAILIGVVGGVGASLYLPVNAQAGGLFFAFLAWPQLFLGLTKLNWNQWWLRLQVYQAAESLKGLFVWYGIGLAVFLGSIFHLKLLSLMSWLPGVGLKISRHLILSIIFTITVLSYVGMNYLQISGGANVFNFLVVAIALALPLTAGVLAWAWQWPLLRAGLVFVLGLTLVQTVWVIWFWSGHYLKGTDSLTLSPMHLQALEYLEQIPGPAVVQTTSSHPLDETTPYLLFFTGRYTYFGGRGILASHNQPVVERSEQFQFLTEFTTNTSSDSASLAYELGITHLLLENQAPETRPLVQAVQDSATISAQINWHVVWNNSEWTVLGR